MVEKPAGPLIVTNPSPLACAAGAAATSASPSAPRTTRDRTILKQGDVGTARKVLFRGVGQTPRCAAATRLGTAIRQASRTISRISTSSLAARQTTAQWYRRSDALGIMNLSGSDATSASRSSFGN